MLKIFVPIDPVNDSTELSKENDSAYEDMEMSRKTKVQVPSFQKRTSPFKIEPKEIKTPTTSFIGNLLKNKRLVDHRWMIIENFKGFTRSSFIKDHIPWLFLRNFTKTNKIIIYFHGNAEDLGGSYHFLQYFQFRIEAHIIAVEYPGYGVYEGSPNEDDILRDARRVIEFILKVLRYSINDVIVLGRSIGTGPAWYLASKHNLAALALISPYTSIRGIVKNMFGTLSQYIIKERFSNIEMMEKINCPTFILHGK